MKTAGELYLQFGLIWAGFCMGCQVCKNSKAGLLKLGLVAVLNLAIWPVSVCLAIYDHDKN